jgi:hypothetical protein
MAVGPIICSDRMAKVAGVVSVVTSPWCAQLGGHGDQLEQVGGDGVRHVEEKGPLAPLSERLMRATIWHCGTSGPTPSTTTGMR